MGGQNAKPPVIDAIFERFSSSQITQVPRTLKSIQQSKSYSRLKLAKIMKKSNIFSSDMSRIRASDTCILCTVFDRFFAQNRFTFGIRCVGRTQNLRLQMPFSSVSARARQPRVPRTLRSVQQSKSYSRLKLVKIMKKSNIFFLEIPQSSEDMSRISELSFGRLPTSAFF